ncbi:hypothetical protein SAMN02745753_04682 [Marinomonas polaris DSM 16579]|uniref:Nitrate reductase n=1 Tax=Marinomonas polaris DSM 16579 TaxID=1122206 RepID=A0A1M5NMA7_9GAMM|nr:nucleotidyltransferase family protein [Marinomonas polaris]SHG90681.1 hypothetical protein SAMN02745753_04682 [Marinomonas polaris DSM 16579]
MKFSDQVIEWIESDSDRMEALELASSLGLNDWCLAAGFVRNLIWDKLHSKEVLTPLNDFDLIYFDSDVIDENTDLEYELRLKSLSSFPWSVKNQARMHIRNNDRPYVSTSDSMSYWVEVETAVGATFVKNKGVTLVTPFGLEANFNNTITLNSGEFGVR